MSLHLFESSHRGKLHRSYRVAHRIRQLRDASLDGLNVAALFYTPGPMHQGNWSAALYLDSRASAQQSDALGKIFLGPAGGAPAVLHPLISKVLGVKSVAIVYHADGRKRRMTIR